MTAPPRVQPPPANSPMQLRKTAKDQAREADVEAELKHFRRGLRRGLIDAHLRRPVPSHVVILRKTRYADVQKATDTIVHHDTGAYVVEAESRFWLTEPIQPGWVTVFVEGNPEGVTERPPVGYGAAHLEYHTGGTLSKVLADAYRRARGEFEWKSWMTAAMVGLFVLGGGALIWLQKTGRL